LVGPVKYDKEKKKQKEREEEKNSNDDSCRTEVLGAVEYCLGKEGCFIGMHHCIGTGMEEENLVSSASANLIPVQLRTLIQALVQEIGENCWNKSTNEEVERRGEKSTALYQYLSYKEKRYWMALFDGYADNSPKFKRDGVEIDYRSYMPTLVCDVKQLIIVIANEIYNIGYNFFFDFVNTRNLSWRSFLAQQKECVIAG
jgi:hypothetical protein